MGNDNSNGFIIDDFGLADRLAKECGNIPSVSLVTSLHSISLYEFNVSAGLLCIKDMDIIKFKDDYQAKEGQQVSLKRVRRGMENPYGCVYRGEETFDYRKLIENKDVLDNVKIIYEDVGENLLVSAKILGDCTFERKCAYGLFLQYEVELGYGQHLFFCGAIQPSDYQGLGMEIGEAQKAIWIYMWSGKGRPFSVWCFNGSAPSYYPPKQPALWDEEKKINKFEWLFNEKISDPGRAKYFSVFAQVQD
ncbi:MAG: hypothetical protein CEE38_17415 [Planctomycetes bacterium B3_Pla]|nr:MAG: hypothetical protein CEE38_17415 [Planctomycetes bacterium B3_Pla]